MRFFKISIDDVPGEEGDDWQCCTRSRCPRCGLNVVQFADRFITCDDGVEKPSIFLDVAEVPSFFRIGGLYFVSDEMKLAITNFSGAPQFTFESVDVENNASFSVHWLRIPGRLTTKPVYFSIGRSCEECGVPSQKRIQPRPPIAQYVVKRSTTSGRYLYAALEHSAPDFVDEDFKAFLESTDSSIRDTISFREIEAE